MYAGDKRQIALRNKLILEKALKNLPAGSIEAVRALNIRWMHDNFVKTQGKPIVAAPSRRTQKWISADEVALISLHQLRTALGTRTQSLESYKWLKDRGLAGLFGDVSHLMN